MPEIDINLIVHDELNFPEEVIQPIRESIAEKGLFHPVLVQRVGYDPDGGGAIEEYKLIAGKKRLRALQQLGIKVVDVKTYPSDLTTDQILELNLHENLKRDNATWYEQVEMRKQLHELRRRMHGGAQTRGGSIYREKGWTQADTARELGIAVGVLNEDIQLANAVATDPSLSKVKDKITALRLIKNRAKREESQAFALLPSDFEMNQVFLGGAEEILKQIPARTFDACITDPPWSQYARNEELTSDQVDLIPVFKEVFRVLKDDSFLFVITSSTDQPHYMAELPKLGFAVQQYPLIWQKNRTITHGRRNWEFARDYEPIILAVKGNPILNSATEISSILNHPNLHYSKMIHPHEKPPELLRQLIKNCSYDGSCILDPFAGSGVTLSTAKECNRQFIGIEKDLAFYNQIVKRLYGR